MTPSGPLAGRYRSRASRSRLPAGVREARLGARAVPVWFRRAVFFVLLAVVALQVGEWLFVNLRSFLGLVFLAWLLSISMEPVVDRLARRGMRRGLATGAVMLGTFLVVVGMIALFGAILVDQLSNLVTDLPNLVDDVVRWVNDTFGTSFRASEVSDSLRLTPERTESLAHDLAPGVLGIVAKLFGLVFQLFTVTLLAFYMSAEAPQLRRTVSSWFPPRHQHVIATVWEIAVDKTGRYVVSKLILALICSFVTGVFLWLLGVPFWLPLALWTGFVSQFIPTVGTYIAIAVPALIALAARPADGLWVVLFGIGYQQVENYILSPRLTARTLSIHPAVGFGAAIVGAILFGPLGALVSVPVVAAMEALAYTYGHRYELVGLEHPEHPEGHPDEHAGMKGGSDPGTGAGKGPGKGPGKWTNRRRLGSPAVREET